MTYAFIGSGIGACGGIKGCEKAPSSLAEGQTIPFETILPYGGDGKDYPALEEYLTILGNTVAQYASTQNPFVIGGDHSCAIGTWSGVHKHYASLNQDIGLIWIDAHMDSHTPQTTLTGNVHGMPLAVLLGHGDSRLCNLLGEAPKFKPEHITLIGIRSYEDDEEVLLNSIGVRIYFMEEIQERGIDAVMREAYGSLTECVKVGISIDMDAFDPLFAPGVGTPAKDGIDFDAFIQTLTTLDLSKTCAFEIAEYNPDLDQEFLTQKNLMRLVEVLTRSHNS